MSKFKKEFTLKQHTPIIHFQSDQSGATLRATELKPKFDRFLIKKLGLTYIIQKNDKDVEVVEEEYQNWFIGQGKQHLALDYKVKIIAQGIKIGQPHEGLFFANTLLDEKKNTVASQSIKVECFSMNKDVLNAIKEWFNDFILINTFGARSSKGYGSFTVTPTNNIEATLHKYFSSVFKVSNINKDRWEQRVDTIHKRLKAGTNYGGYNKSLLFEYMCDAYNLRWEKRKIKQEFPSVVRPSHKQPVDCVRIADDKFRFIRAMLGLPSNYEYNNGDEVIEISGGEIERFKSPITYKFIDNTLYILGNDTYQQIANKPFDFKFNNKFTLRTPSQNEFDLYEFLKYVAKNTNLITEVQK